MFGKKNLVTHTLNVEGMACPKCSARVEAALKAIKGVKTVTVDLAAKTVTVTATEAVTPTTLSSAITEAGYTVV